MREIVKWCPEDVDVGTPEAYHDLVFTLEEWGEQLKEKGFDSLVQEWETFGGPEP
ncbi:MAG: hypothetical protein AAF829_05360 [Pseudomonadota bacterium]